MRTFDFVLFDRDGKSGSGERSNMINLIKERAEEAEKGDRSAILVLAEGCTTYNTHVIRMKKGAFVHLKPVQPFSSKIWYPLYSPNDGGGLAFVSLVALGFNTGFWTNTISEMPVFSPNEYFWKHHWDGKEEKWVAYARAIQTLIAETSGLKVS